MEPPASCQSCRREVTEGALDYRKGSGIVHHQGLLQCDVCERFACADCLRVYDIVSGYDFLCDHCAREMKLAAVKPGH